MSLVAQAPFALWITGLPASGKSSIVAQLIPKLQAIGIETDVLESDAVRRLKSGISSTGHWPL
jgi:adenylylsulfate kinase